MTKRYKSVKDSQVIMTELMQPHQANFGGKIHGGHLLSLIDKGAYVCATKHSESYCVTVSVDAVEFLHPIEVGELVSFFASVNYTGSTSMRIGIKVIAENIQNKSVRHTNSCYINMVAVDEEGKPREIPGLVLSDHIELRRFMESKTARQMAKEHKKRFKVQKDNFFNTFDEEQVAGENCTLDFKD